MSEAMPFELLKGQGKTGQIKSNRSASLLTHSQTVYGSPVETGKPYSCHYMSECILKFY